MEHIELRSGPATVVASGTVIAFEGNPVEFRFGSPEDPLVLVLEFKDDKEKQEPRVDYALTDENRTLKLTLFNFNNPLGIGSVKPIHPGKLGGNPLYIHYRVYPLAEGDKTIHYTIYSVSGDAVKEGTTEGNAGKQDAAKEEAAQNGE